MMLQIRDSQVDKMVGRLKRTSEYTDKFKRVLNKKNDNENKAREIIERNLGGLTEEHVSRIFELVDEPYNRDPLWDGGGPPQWFGKLVKMNGRKMLNESKEKINRWFITLADKQKPAEDRIRKLLKDPSYKISGAAMGLITLVLYLLDKQKYSIWFGPLHEGMAELYPALGQYSGKVEFYRVFNEYGKGFIREYNFDHTELDYIQTAITRLKNGTIS